jgi:hypothetical protein
VITAVTRLLTGTPPAEVITSWRLAATMEGISTLLPSFSGIQTSHVKRKANQLADQLANEGFKRLNTDLDKAWEETLNNTLKQDCLRINQTNLLHSTASQQASNVETDLNHPDGVLGKQRHPTTSADTCPKHSSQALDKEEGDRTGMKRKNILDQYGISLRGRGNNGRKRMSDIY